MMMLKNKKGIYQYILTRAEKIRAFSDSIRQKGL